jgi:hypothetical protein
MRARCRALGLYRHLRHSVIPMPPAAAVAPIYGIARKNPGKEPGVPSSLRSACNRGYLPGAVGDQSLTFEVFS